MTTLATLVPFLSIQRLATAGHPSHRNTNRLDDDLTPTAPPRATDADAIKETAARLAAETNGEEPWTWQRKSHLSFNSR